MTVKPKSKAKIGKSTPPPPARIAVGIRLSPELREALGAIAREEGRTLSNMVQRALEEWLKDKTGKTK
jgi:predicted DNA-binding protein